MITEITSKFFLNVTYILQKNYCNYSNILMYKLNQLRQEKILESRMRLLLYEYKYIYIYIYTFCYVCENYNIVIFLTNKN